MWAVLDSVTVLWFEFTDEIIKGIQVTRKCSPNWKKLSLGLKNNKPEAMKHLKKQVVSNFRLSIQSCEQCIHGGSEKILIKIITGREFDRRIAFSSSLC